MSSFLSPFDENGLLLLACGRGLVFFTVKGWIVAVGNPDLCSGHVALLSHLFVYLIGATEYFWWHRALCVRIQDLNYLLGMRLINTNE